MNYIALIRGIGPGDPRMTNDKLRGVFESLGFGDVKSLISSGNFIFSSPKTPSETEIEKAIEQQLGFFRPVVIRSQGDIQHIINLKPFGISEHSQEYYTLVTFLKNPLTELPFDIPLQNAENFFEIIAYDKKTRAIFSVTNHTAVPNPKIMVWLEKQLGKENVTSRTWKTVGRIHNKF
jgi:uncharacterized protein (DUF1697 family)